MDFDKEDIKNRSALYKKKSKLRELVLKCDWKKDGFMLLGGKRIDYITSEKVVRNFAPLLTQVGLEIECGFKEPVRLAPFGQRAEEHWMSTFYVQYVDVDTGYATRENTYHGEGMDQRDKALKKANTDAQKLWLLADFKIGEGVDPDAGVNDTQGAYIPKDEEEKVEIKTKIAAAAVKPKAPAPKPKAEEPKEEVKIPVEVKVENVEEQIKETAEEAKPAAPRLKAPAPAPKSKAEEPKDEEPEETATVAIDTKGTVEVKPATPKPKVPAPAPKAPAPKDTAVTNQIAPGMNTDFGKTISEAQKKPLFGLFGKWVVAHNSGNISDERFEEVKKVYADIGSNRDIIRFLAEYREIK